MQVLGKVRHPGPGSPNRLSGRAPAPTLGAGARPATERAAVREHLKAVGELEGDFAYLLRNKTELEAGSDSSQLMSGESCSGGAGVSDEGSGRREVHRPLRDFITSGYAENSSLGRFLRAWRSQAPQDPAKNKECKSAGGSACRKGLFPCAAPFVGKERKRHTSSRGRQRESDRALAEELVTIQIGVANWIACGSTPTPPPNLRAPTTEAHVSMLELAQEQALRFARASRKEKPTVNSGRAGATLVETLRALEEVCSEMGDEYVGELRKVHKP